MGKNNTYYFIARNKKTNDFNIVDIGNSLEDIDLYTINFTGNPQLIKDLKSKGKIVDEDVDIYIVLPKKENNEKNLYYMDILYSDSKNIKNIAEGFKNNKKPATLVDEVLNNFCYRMQHDSRFFDMIMLGKTNLYPKFVKYFEGRKYDSFYDVKYRDGAWAQRSYPLIRNIYDAFSKSTFFENRNINDEMYRKLIEGKILYKTGNGDYDNQMDLFDYSEFTKDNISDEDKLLEVVTFISHLDQNIFKKEDNKLVLSRDKFSKIDEDKFNELSRLLDRRLITYIYYYLEHKKIYDDPSFRYFNDSYDKLLEDDQEGMLKLLKNKNVLDDAYSFIKVYNKYILGEEYGKQKRKGE